MDNTSHRANMNSQREAKREVSRHSAEKPQRDGSLGIGEYCEAPIDKEF